MTDASYNGMFPVWYQTDSTHISWSQTGADSSSSGGTVQTAIGGDTSGLNVIRNTFYESWLTGISISSASISSSVLTMTLASPAIIYANQWVWTTGSSDPVYNGYWQVLTVTSPTTFTASSVWPSEAATTSGTFYSSNEGMSIGGNAFANRGASVCCLNIEKNNFYGNGTTTGPWPLFGIVEDGDNGNTKNFYSKGNLFNGLRIVWQNINGGTFISDGDHGSGIVDALFASSVNGTMLIENEEWESALGSNEHEYVLANMPSGSYNASTAGVNGQFELNGTNVVGTAELSNNSFQLSNYASDGVALSTGASLILRGNTFYENGSTTQQPVLNVPTSFSSSGRSSTISENNTYANVPAGGWAPFTSGSSTMFSTTFGTGYPLKSMFDKTWLSNGTYPLANTETLTELRYRNPTGTSPYVAGTGFIKLPNNVQGICWRDSSGSGTEDCLSANALNQLVFSNAAGSFVIPEPGFTGLFAGTTGSIGGSALTAGTCASGTATVTGATTAMAATASPVTYPGDAFGWRAYVSAAGTVTVKVCTNLAAGGTPTASTYNVRVIQ